MKLPTVCQAEKALRRCLNIVTPVAIFFIVLSAALDVRDGRLDTLLFGPNRYSHGVTRMTCGSIACFASIVGLVICAIAVCGGCEEARRTRPITRHFVAHLVTFLLATYLMSPRLR